MYGLLWWIVGPITFGALLDGEGPNWSLLEASNVFPSLIGHLLYGGLTGFGFYVFVTLYLLVRPEPEPSVAVQERPKNRVVILGGGFGGVSVAKRLEQIYSRDDSMEITLVSESHYLLFTPMLAEVASSGLEAQHISAPIVPLARIPDFTGPQCWKLTVRRKWSGLAPAGRLLLKRYL